NCTAALVAPRGPFQGPESPTGPQVPLSGVLGALLVLLLGTWLVASGFVAPASRRLLAVTASEGGRPVGFAKLAPALVLLVAVVLPLCLAGCGVSNLPPALPNQPTTPAGTYPLTIVGTGPTGAKVTLMLTVKVI
ncbi:MAG TPA: hypothetical protein VL099_15145, partial [Candidatus Binatia bacterium]|nr:hypothetical protein [Candidatus Binatia bacterium]